MIAINEKFDRETGQHLSGKQTLVVRAFTERRSYAPPAYLLGSAREQKKNRTAVMSWRVKEGCGRLLEREVGVSQHELTFTSLPLFYVTRIK